MEVKKVIESYGTECLFVKADLANVEANGYTLTEDMMVGDVTIPAGLYTDIHCEEHGDHDH